MRKFFALLTTIVILLTSTLLFAGCQVRNLPNNETFDPEQAGYEVTFVDDFDGDKLDTTKWRMFNGDSNIESKKQIYDHNYRGGYYSNDNDILFTKDGNLHIATKYKKNGKYGEGWYTSWIETSTRDDSLRCFDETDDFVGFSQKYGYFEIRCIAPPAEGLWSAFWLLPDEGVAHTPNDVQWTAEDGAEIDVMESQNYFRKKSFCQHVVHADYYPKSNTLKSDKSLIYDVKDMYTQFHTYAVEWTENKIAFYIDGHKTYETAVVYDDKVLGTPKIKECILLSVEIAGYADEDGIHVGKDKNGKKSWLGSLDNMDKSKSYDFIIDYVKVMQKKN